MKKGILFLVLPALILAGCGTPKPAELSVGSFGIKITVPSAKWTVAVSNYGSEDKAEVSNVDGMRAVEIKKEKTATDSVETLVKASESTGLTLINKETLSNGFGATFKDTSSNKTVFIYDIKVGENQYRCQNGAYYKETDLAAALDICKSIK